jgi:hypothetical protein
MPAPKGNCNAAKNKAKCRANKGWYAKSGSRKFLEKNMKDYQRGAKAIRKMTSAARRKKIRSSEYQWDW